MNYLHLGCGKDYKSNYVNLDISHEVKADVHHDLNIFPYPFKDDYFQEIYTHHTLEHFRGEQLMNILPELYRISKNQAKWIVIVPYFSYSSSLGEILHRQGFSTTTFDLFKEDCLDYGFQVEKPIKLQIVKVKLTFGKLHRYLGLQWFFNRKQRLYEAMFCYIFPAREISYELKVKK